MNNSRATIRVLIADDHPVVRTGIRDELAKHADLELVGEATNGDQALELATSTEADVLVLDINMPGLPAVRVARELQDRQDAPRILVLSAYGDLESVLEMLRAGVRGYMLKDEDPIRIPEGVRAVATGSRWLSSEIGGKIAKNAARGELMPRLTPRELEVLQLMALGRDNQQIATQLSISEGTVKNHVTSLYTKLDVNSRAEAVAWTWKHKIVRSDDVDPSGGRDQRE